MKPKIVAFVYPNSVDVYLRTDDGHGRIEYHPLSAGVVRNDQQPGTLLQRLASICVSLLVTLVG